MYAIMVHNSESGNKRLLQESLMERSDENLEKLGQACEEWKAEFPECNYFVVKIDYEVMK